MNPVTPYDEISLRRLVFYDGPASYGVKSMKRREVWRNE